MQKFVSARVAALGEIVEWTVVVTNNGPQTATGVTITDDAAAGATIVSLQVPQGTCGEPAAHWARSRRWVGSRRRPHRSEGGGRLNVVGVRGEQPDSLPENNVASALIRVLSSFRRRSSAGAAGCRSTVGWRGGRPVPANAVVRMSSVTRLREPA